MATYDPTTGTLSWGDKVDPALGSPGSPAPATLGEESWKWLFLQPLIKTQE
jgi:phospholipid/cholesterol/gamma-HCH transport system substrate-binding protein